MKKIIFPTILSLTLMGCASVDSTTNNTDTRKTEVEANIETEIETLAETLFVTPSQAEALYNDGKHAEAFDMHYVLATSGYDWSQFNIGVAYYTGIEGKIEIDYVEAYAWMITSELIRQENFRLDGINTLEDMLNEEQLDEAEKRSSVLFAQYGSGKRTQPRLQFFEAPSELGQPAIVFTKQQVVAEDPERCSGVGTRIRSVCTGSHSYDTTAEFLNLPMRK